MSGTYRTIKMKDQVSPPRFIIQCFVSFSIGQSSQVVVSTVTEDPAGDSVVTVVTFDNVTAQALANLVKSSFEFGDITIKVLVVDTQGNKYGPERPPTVEDLKTALHNNPLVYDVAENKIACTPVVVQFWDGNIYNPRGFISMLAADAFNEVVVDDITAYTTGKKLTNN